MLKKSQVSSDKKDPGFVWIIEGILSILSSLGIILILYLQISTKQRQGNGTMSFFLCSIGSWLYFFAILLTGCWGSQVSPYMIILIRTPWPWRFPSQFVDTQVSHICRENGFPQHFFCIFFFPLNCDFNVLVEESHVTKTFCSQRI